MSLRTTVTTELGREVQGNVVYAHAQKEMVKTAVNAS